VPTKINHWDINLLIIQDAYDGTVKKLREDNQDLQSKIEDLHKKLDAKFNI
jgi:predicted  nucleic acid-binding Zn-ribbon protein